MLAPLSLRLNSHASLWGASPSFSFAFDSNVYTATASATPFSHALSQQQVGTNAICSDFVFVPVKPSTGCGGDLGDLPDCSTNFGSGNCVDNGAIAGNSNRCKTDSHSDHL